MHQQTTCISPQEYKKLVWDYDLSSDDFFAILKGEKTQGWLTQNWALARVLENLDYYRARDLVGVETLKKHWDGVKKLIHDPVIRRGYEYVLRRDALSSAR